RLIDHPRIMGPDGEVIGPLEQDAHQLRVVLRDFPLGGEDEAVRLPVSPLHEPYPRPLVDQPREVALAAPQVGLQSKADVLESLPRPEVDLQSPLEEARAFHVNPEQLPQTGRLSGCPQESFLAPTIVGDETELSALHRDAPVYLVLADGPLHPQVLLQVHLLPGFVFVVFAEVVYFLPHPLPL